MKSGFPSKFLKSILFALLLPIQFTLSQDLASKVEGLYNAIEKRDENANTIIKLPKKHNSQTVNVSRIDDKTVLMTVMRRYIIRGKKFTENKMFRATLVEDNGSINFTEVGEYGEFHRRGYFKDGKMEDYLYDSKRGKKLQEVTLAK